MFFLAATLVPKNKERLNVIYITQLEKDSILICYDSKSISLSSPLYSMKVGGSDPGVSGSPLNSIVLGMTSHPSISVGPLELLIIPKQAI